MITLPNELIYLILKQLPACDLIFINKYYNNFKYCRLKQLNMEVSPIKALRRFTDLQINLITHSKFDYFKNMITKDDEKYVFTLSNAKRNKKRHTIPPEIFKDLEMLTLYLENDPYENISVLSIKCLNCEYWYDFKMIETNRFYDWTSVV